MSEPTDPAVVSAYAEAFLSAGGTITLGDWADMDQPTREAFEAAGTALEAARLARLATALGLNAAAGAILAPHDGGEALAFDSILRQMSEVTGGRGQ